MRQAIRIIHSYIIMRPNPLHILLVLAARDPKLKVPKEELIYNFCQRPGRMHLDH